jgi:HAD superfamily hydrolase (TIGR01509 family)
VTPRPILEAVVFDAGGTLVRIDFEWMSEMLAGLGLAIGTDTLRRAELDGRRAYDRSASVTPDPDEPPPALGTVGDTQAYLGGTLAAAGVPAGLLPAALELCQLRHRRMGLWTRPMEGARAAMDALAAAGLRLAVVSNSDGRAEQHLVDCEVRSGLEFVIDSHLVGVEKPDPAIFLIALERLGIAAERALYVGDIRSVDEAGSRAAGLHFVLIDPIGDYAPPGTPRIADIAALAPWVEATFELQRSTSAPSPSTSP